MTRKRWLRSILIAILAPLALLVIALWTAPWWLDLSGVKAEIARIMAVATGGTARYERVDIRLLPRPRTIITGVIGVLAAVASFYNMTNRLASATDMRPNKGYHAMAR